MRKGEGERERGVVEGAAKGAGGGVGVCVVWV